MFGLGVLGSLGTVPGNSGPSFDPAAVDFFARIPAQTPTRYALLNTVFVGLRAAGILSLLDCLWLMAAADSPTARANLISSSFALTPTAAPTFTADQGYAGDGASSFLSTGFNPTVGTPKYSQNSAHMSVYDRTSRAAASQGQMGFYSTGVSAILINRNTGDSILNRINDGGGSLANTNSSGHFIGSRPDSASRSNYRNGASLGTVSVASGAPLNGVWYLCGINGNAFTTDQLAQASIGAGLTALQAAAFYTIIQAYMTGVGAQV